MNNWALGVAGTIFFVFALIHLIRLFYPFSVVIAGVSIPLWVNAIGFVVLGLLSAWLFYCIR